MEHQIITKDIKTNNGNLMTTSSGQWEKQFDGLWMVSIQCDMNLDSSREQTGYIIASEMQIVFLGIIPVQLFCLLLLTWLSHINSYWSNPTPTDSKSCHFHMETEFPNWRLDIKKFKYNLSILLKFFLSWFFMKFQNNFFII